MLDTLGAIGRDFVWPFLSTRAIYVLALVVIYKGAEWLSKHHY